MIPSDSVQQAIDLLALRHRELCDELENVSVALRALGADPDRRAAAKAVGDQAATQSLMPAVLRRLKAERPRPSVRLAVSELLMSEHRTFSTDETAQALRGRYPDTDDVRFRANVRSALYQLKMNGDVRLVGRALYLHSKWNTNAESPAATIAGLSDAVDLTPIGGEHTDGQGSHHDHRFDFAGRHSDRDNLGAPVGH